MRNVILTLFALLLSGCSGSDPGAFLREQDIPTSTSELSCGWLEQHTWQLPELPAGDCWLVRPLPGSASATSVAGADACDVEPGIRKYKPGISIAEWGSLGSAANKGIDMGQVPCQGGGT